MGEAVLACKSFEDGEFDKADAVVTLDLNADGIDDTLIDESRFACSSAASMYCGSGGCMLHVVVGEVHQSWQATGWRVVDWYGVPILLIGRDGGWCGASGAEACFEAVNWSDGRFLSVKPPLE